MSDEWSVKNATPNELMQKGVYMNAYADAIYMNKYLKFDVPTVSMDDWQPVQKIYIQGHKITATFDKVDIRIYFSQKMLMYRFEYRAIIGGKEIVSVQEVTRQLFDNLQSLQEFTSLLDLIRKGLVDGITSQAMQMSTYTIVSDDAEKYLFSTAAGKTKKLTLDWTITGGQASHAPLQSSVQKVLPSGEKSIYEVSVDCPACSDHYTVYYAIQHLNDAHKWDRKTQIADWLDTLHDAGIIDITITSPDPDKA